MDSIRIRKGPVRALVAVCLLAGVFAMHGLTGNHEVAMALTQHVPTAATTHHSTTTGVAADHSATTADHTTAAATGHNTTVGAAGHNTVGAVGHNTVGASGHTAAAADLGGIGVAPAVQSGVLQAAPELIAQPGHDGHLHSMGDVCLAMLAALLLALVVALALRSLTVAHPAVLAAAAIRVATDGPSPPWRRPTLSKLCVLRT